MRLPQNLYLSLQIILKPLTLNYWFENDSSILVSEVRQTSFFFFFYYSTDINLFFKEFTFTRPTHLSELTFKFQALRLCFGFVQKATEYTIWW